MKNKEYNLTKAQEESEKLQKKVASGEASNYGDAEKLVGQESLELRERIQLTIKQIAYKPEVILQNEDILSDPEKFNKYVLDTLFGKTRLLKTRETFEYIRDNIDSFRGTGTWPDDATPYQVNWLIDSTVELKKSVAEVISVLQDVFSLTNDQREKVLVDLYSSYCASSYVKSSDILKSLKQELPLDEEKRVLAAKQHLTKQLSSLATNYSRDKKDSSNWSMKSHLYKVWDLQNESQQSKVNLSIEADLFNDPEVIAEGQKLLKAILNSEIDVSLQMSNIPALYKIAPSFFQGDFTTEGHKLWDNIVEYGSYSDTRDSYSNYDKTTLEILRALNYDTEKIRALFKETLVTHLASSHILEGLIEKYVKGTEYANLLQDSDVVQAGSIGRKTALENLSPIIFSKISEMFNFSQDWATNPEDVALVKKGVLSKIGKLYSIQEISRIQNEFGDAIIINDPEIRSAIEKAILEDSKPWPKIDEHWAETRDIFNTWNFPIDKLQEYAKGFVIDKLSTATSYEIHKFTWTERCLGAFPEILDLPEIHELASSKILEWKYQKESYGYRKLNSAIEDIGKAIKLYKLSPELLDQWKTKVVSIELADIKDKEQLKEFKELLKHLKVSPEGLSGRVNESYLKALSAGDLKQTSFLVESFSIDPKNISETELQKAGEIGMSEALQQENFQNIVKIQEICHLSQEFFTQPEVNNKISQLLADQFLCRGEFEDLQEKIDLFGLSSEAYPIIDAQASYSEQLSSNITKFIRYLGNENIVTTFPQTFEHVRELIFSQLAENENLADYFLENLSKYYKESWTEEGVKKSIHHYSVANKFVQAVEDKKADWINESWITVILAEAEKILEEHEQHWDDDEDEYHSAENEGLLDEDLFKDDPLRKIRSSLGLGRIMAEKLTPAEAGLELSAEALEALREINGTLEKEHDSFLERFGKSSAVPEEDKTALTDQSQSKVKMNNLLPNVRNFVGRYLAQLANGDPEKLSEIIVSQKDSVERIVQEGYRRYLKIYEVDIPLYDKLYEEFDHWREAGRYPMEVYLGRDGIYAYIGRRAQDATRRSKVGRKKREELRSEGDVIEINPKYLVYPRYFRDYINYDTKRAFLEQEQISPDMDPLFYDTGYTGTIPEQIMRVMGFDQADIEERIRLLSAPTAKRRVKGIPENARSEIIEYIEHNAKTENTAVGLLQDERTGKIRHVARPTDPEEQFYFMMIKQAISRHYMVQERFHFEAPENANYDSEDYYIRVRQEYTDILPADFIKNPKQYFEQQGTLLKGSKGEGEYPDEEVLSFKLKDGTEVIAKRVELRKSKEARKEFMILIASKKAGLLTAEPVGFLSGKKEEDGSYLLMEKLEGYSGRKFEKYLQKSGKFTDAQITGIMKTVAEKLKDLAQMFRDQLNIDKRWRIKDTIIQFNEETGEVEDVIPIDWERVKTYDPNKPQKIDLVD